MKVDMLHKKKTATAVIINQNNVYFLLKYGGKAGDFILINLITATARALLSCKLYPNILACAKIN